MKIYTYGIIDSNASIIEPINGLEGACVYNLPYRDIGAAVSKLINLAPVGRSGVNQIKEINRDDVLKHEEVVERLMENSTVLPVRFFTTFNQEEEVMVMLKEYYQDFKENLSKLRNKVEFGIRVIWPGETIRNRIIEASKKFNAFATKSPQCFGDPPKHCGGNGESAKQCGGNFGGDVTMPDSSPGKIFAKEKFERYKIDKEFAEEANRCIALLDDFFSKFAAEKKLEKLKSDNLLLNAYYLVEKEKQGDFKEAFERAKNTPGDLKYLFSGPWPPYNFINLNKKPYCFKDLEGIDILEKETNGQNLTNKEAV